MTVAMAMAYLLQLSFNGIVITKPFVLLLKMIIKKRATATISILANHNEGM